MTSTTKILGLGLGAAIALTGCTDPGQFDPNDPNRNQRQGAIAGGLLGATAGILLGDNAQERRRGALIGGAVGAAGGAIVGNQLDRQAAELAQSLDGRIGIINTGNELIVRMPQDVLFDIDSAALRPDLRSDLQSLAVSLNRYPDTTVQVIGHTDNTGSADYNLDLSQRRARAVTAELQLGGVAPARLLALGAGEDQPIASNLTAEGRAQNRRVDITIRPNG